MAQVGVQQPTNLMEMFSSPSLMLGDIAAQQVNDQTLGNRINRQQAQQAMEFAAQEQPFRLDEMGLKNQTTRAQLPGVQAESGLKQNALTRDTATNDSQIKAALSKLAKETSDNDYAVFENGVHQMRASSDPRIRAQGNALFPYLKAIATERDKLNIQGGNQIAAIREQGKIQNELEDKRINAGKYDKTNKYLDFWSNFNTKLKSAKDKHAALLLEAVKEEQDGNIEGAAKFRQMAEEIRPQVEAEINAGAKPDQIDLNALSQGKIPTQPKPRVAPPTGGPTNQRKYNSADEVKAAFRAGNISREQARELLKGYGYNQ